MLPSQRIAIRRSEYRERVNVLYQKDDRTKEQDAELREKTDKLQSLEAEYRAALTLEDQGTTEPAHADAEERERISLRSQASLTKMLLNAARGRLASGPEAELQAAAGVGDNVPLELWDTPTETRQDAITGAPSTVGVNLDPILPAVFAPSIAPRLGIQMPRVSSGTYASATIDTSLTASARAKGDAQEATAATFSVSTATPKAVSIRLGLDILDIASVGQANYEPIMRENLSLRASDELDNQIINGDGTAPNLAGILNRLTDPDAPGAGVETFDRFVGAFATGVDGLWASRMNEVGIVCGPATYRLSAVTYRDKVVETATAGAASLGDISFADYAMSKFGGWWTNKRMPDAVSNVQTAILHRRGRSAMKTAVCPHWGRVAIDDIYSGSAKGQRFFTLHVLVGDVALTQPDAYSQVAYRVSA